MSPRTDTAEHLHVRILLATLNGATFLPAQLESYCTQTHRNWSLEAADDGSSDATLEILNDFAARMRPDHEVRLHDGPRQGATASFLSLARKVALRQPGAYLAFSDQDDVWLPHKLRRAAVWMSERGADRGAPLVYASRTTLADAQLGQIGPSHLHRRGPAFANSLVQNILGGNTIVLSPAAAQILALSIPAALAAGVPYHDWWIYQILSGAGATIWNDAEPGLLYRQHSRNLLGHHGPVRGRIKRLGALLRRDYGHWIDGNLAALAANEALLTPENVALMRDFASARRQGGKHLVSALRELGVHRQTATGDRMLRLLARSGRL